MWSFHYSLHLSSLLKRDEFRQFRTVVASERGVVSGKRIFVAQLGPTGATISLQSAAGIDGTPGRRGRDRSSWP